MLILPPTEIREQLLEFFSETFPLFDSAMPDTTPMAEHGIDSLGTTETVLYLEDHFQIQIEDSELTRANLGTLQGILDFVERKLKE